VVKKKQETQVEDTRSQEYELVYILSPEMTEDVLDSKVESINQFITARDGVIDGVDKWGKKKLAYPLKHFLEGSYFLTKFKISPARCKELDTNLKISEEVLRHLLIKVGG
jgi:small subunit ribosomal protein S6